MVWASTVMSGENLPLYYLMPLLSVLIPFIILLLNVRILFLIVRLDRTIQTFTHSLDDISSRLRE